MATLPSTRFVFDRKHTSTKEKRALVQLEILYKGRRKFISTGVKLCRDQWSDKSLAVNTADRDQLNERLHALKEQVDTYINNVCASGREFDFDTFSQWLANAGKKEAETFIEWTESRILERTDITESSRKTQLKLIGLLQRWNVIVRFEDLTKKNILLFDDYLHAQGIRQSTVWSYHKTMKTYVHEAIRRELITDDPYISFKANRGKSEWGRFLTADEVALVERVALPTESLCHVRDLFLMQCYTGLAYSDLMSVDFRAYTVVDGIRLLTSQRQKTHVTFTTIISDKALAIIRRYDFHLPHMSNAQYNLRLKLIADACGINKPIASHWGRRTCGMLLLNDGIPIEIVAKVLGHSNIKTTQEAYARILDYAVAQAFKK